MCVLQVFSELFKSPLNDNFYEEYAREIIEVSLRVRLSNDPSGNNPENSAKHAASEVLEVMESKIGSAEFIGRYSEVQQYLTKQKLLRKQSIAVNAVKDPVSHAEYQVLLKL